MTARRLKSDKVWTAAEAKARLSEVLRLSEEEGPQRIGTRRTYVVVPERLWKEREPERMPLGKWLVENMPWGIDLELPDRRDGNREIPFASGDDG